MNEYHKSGQCMFVKDGERCSNDIYNGGRGLCPTHYVGYYYHVKKGNITWKEIEKKGLCVRKLTQAEKNINQMHKHRSYIKTEKHPSFDREVTEV